jgi:hypothetical protein
VIDCAFAPGRWPGVLLEWRLEPSGWMGRVALAVPDEDGTLLIEAWVPATQLRPAQT